MSALLRGMLAATVLLVGLAAPAAADSRGPIVAFGDSITIGAGTTDPERDAYPVVAGIGSVGNGGQCLVTVGCVHPETLLDSFRREVRAMPVKPRLAIAEIGVNDLAHLTDAQFKAAYRALVRMGRSMGVRVVLGTIPPSNGNWPWHDAIHEQQQRINHWIRSRGTYVDYARALEGRGGFLRAAYDYGDGLHPNTAGARAMAAALTDWMETR